MRLLVAASLIAVSGCVSTATHEEVVAERDTLAARVAALEGDLATMEAEKRRIERQVEEARAAGEREARMRAELGLGEGQKLFATLQTSEGDIHCTLLPEVAPKTVANFVGLAEGTKEWTDPRSRETTREPLYDGTVFHRIIPDFMIQGGDPLGNGTGGPGYEFEDEVSPEVTFSEPGLLAMANAGPGTNGSQFFVTDSTPAHLNGRHTIFGKCDLETVRRIMALPLEMGADGARSRPTEEVTLRHVAIERRAP